MEISRIDTVFQSIFERIIRVQYYSSITLFAPVYPERGYAFLCMAINLRLPFAGERYEWCEEVENENVSSDKNNGMYYVYEYNTYVVIVRRVHIARKNTTIIIS